MNKYCWYLILASIAISPSVSAQELEEIVVSAQRREESLQDVPVSITAFSAETLKRQNIKEAKDYLTITPNVNFTEDGELGARSVGIAMRGVSDLANSFTGGGGLASSFGIYLDEFNIANNATKTANPQLQDLQRLEILRGPQGTYFGRNATGGAMNLTTKLPHEGLEYELGGGYSRFNTWGTDAMVNFGVTDNFFVRANVSYEESDGFLKNLSATGSGNDYEHTSFRIAARWLVNEQITADLSYMRTIENDGTDSNINSGVLDIDTPGSTPSIIQPDPIGAPTVFAAISDVVPIAPAGAGFFPNNRRYIDKDAPEFNKNRQNVVNLRLNYQGDDWSLRSITGVMKTTSRRLFDQDLVGHSLYITHGGRTGDTFSEELRFNLQRDNWDLTIGGLYANDDADTYGISPIGTAGFAFAFAGAGALLPDGTLDPAAGCFCLAPGGIISGPSVDTFDVESFAVFAELNYQFNEQFKATVGIRYTDDTVEVKEADFSRVPFDQQPFGDIKSFRQPSDTTLVDGSIPGALRNPFRQGKASFDSITPRFVLNWSPNDELNTYASVSKGYKPGGIVFDETTLATIPFKKESLWNYELGFKWRGFNDRVSVNASGFYMDWKDMQVPSVEILIDATGNIVNNFRIDNSKAKSVGFELEAQALATDNILIGGGVGYLDAEFSAFGADDPFPINNMGFDLDGVTIPRSPKWTINLFGQYDFTVKGLDSFVRAEWTYRSKITSDMEAAVSELPILDNAVTAARGLDTSFGGTGFSNGFAFPWPRVGSPSSVPSYDVTNLRAGISGERWSVTAYVENVFDKNYYTGTQENFGLGGFRIRPHFRTAGINFRLYSQ
ncbi:MAG: TonB-dependent receptor [Gammaproteobacteria bacterium]|nr:TonB-dependent receptor [Gammaproteobacteria bacterium]